jgi:hypothetical protein
VQIKKSEGRTLLSFMRLGIIFIACLSIGNVQSWADATFAFTGNAGNLIHDFLYEETSSDATAAGDSLLLYYTQSSADGKGTLYVYQRFYLTGSGNARGLRDASGQQLLPDEYSDIMVLPAAYCLNNGSGWQLFDRTTLQPLSDLVWDDVKLELADSGLLSSDLIQVEKDGLFGAIDMQGEIVIEPLYDDFELYAFDAAWPLIRVKQDGRYGYINHQGEVVVGLDYDYAVLGSLIVHADENDAEGEQVPVIFVKRGDDWGGILKQGDEPSRVDWDIQPSEAALAAQENLATV